MQDVAPEQLGHPGDVGQLVDQSGGHEQPPGEHRPAVGEDDAEAVVHPLGRGDPAVDEPPP